MKRTSAAIVLLAGLGGCTSPDKQTVEGARPFNKAVVAKSMSVMPDVVQASAKGTAGQSDVVTADARGNATGGISQTAGFSRVNGMSGPGCAVGPDGSCNTGNGLPPYGPTTSGFRQMIGHGAGIMPVPAMGVPGAVAFPGGLGGPGSGMYSGQYMGGRTSVRFANPPGMKITWQTAGGFSDNGLEAPARYNFPQANMYRLRLSGIPNRPGKNYYPTLEVYPATAKTITFLSHSTVPVTFTDEDFEQVNAGNLVVKVIYLPDEKYQDLVGAAGADEVVSTRLEPGVNPIEEANRRGTILAVIRIGNADLQDPNTPPLDAPVGFGMAGMPSMPNPAVPRPTTMPAPAAPTTMMPAPLPGTVKTPGMTVAAPKTITLPATTR